MSFEYPTILVPSALTPSAPASTPPESRGRALINPVAEVQSNGEFLIEFTYEPTTTVFPAAVVTPCRYRARSECLMLGGQPFRSSLFAIIARAHLLTTSDT